MNKSPWQDKDMFFRRWNKSFFWSVLLLAALLCNCSLEDIANAEEVTNDLNAWETIVLQIPLSERWRLNTLTQIRTKHKLSDAERFLQFADVNYFVDKDKHWSVGAGYAWTPSFEPKFRNENRVYEQVIFQHPLKGGQFTGRNRLEQRFIADAASVANWNRTLLQYSQPIPKISGCYWTAWNEILVQLYGVHNGPKRGLDQNRTYVGVGKNLTNHLRLEGGYMLLYAHRPGPAAESLAHTLMTQLVIH
jgi:hypothetical protein